MLHYSTDPVPVVSIHGETNDLLLPNKRKLTDIEGIAMGEELCDVDTLTWPIQFPELGGLQSTLLQQKEAPILEIRDVTNCMLS